LLTTILFDVDGTLIDTEYAVVTSFRQALHEVIGVDPPAGELDFILGIPGSAAVDRYADSAAAAERLDASWAAHSARLQRTQRLFDQISTTLTALRRDGFALGIVTSRTDAEMTGDLRHFGLDDTFDVVVTSSDTIRHKPDPDPVLHALHVVDVRPDQALYVGDSVYDMQCANAAGVEFVVAGWGARDLTVFTRAAAVIASPPDLIGFVERHTSDAGS
jgi:HAD superfamily hydrolase (TIGR01549 family)